MKRKRQLGFTLLELLVVLVIMGIMLGAISLTAVQSTHQRLQTDAQRLSLLLQMAREEAIVRNRPTAFEANSEGYRFLVLNENRWEQIEDLESLRSRTFTFSNTQLEIIPRLEFDDERLRIVFGREPVSRPFILNLRVAENTVAIKADGVGHFVVE